jgi:hypothetical protein
MTQLLQATAAYTAACIPARHSAMDWRYLASLWPAHDLQERVVAVRSKPRIGSQNLDGHRDARGQHVARTDSSRNT